MVRSGPEAAALPTPQRRPQTNGGCHVRWHDWSGWLPAAGHMRLRRGGRERERERERDSLPMRPGQLCCHTIRPGRPNSPRPPALPSTGGYAAHSRDDAKGEQLMGGIQCAAHAWQILTPRPVESKSELMGGIQCAAQRLPESMTRDDSNARKRRHEQRL